MHTARAIRLQVLAVVFPALLLVGSACAGEAPPVAAARTIVLIRHGNYQPDKADSSPGPGLSPLGIAQAKLVAARLAAMPGAFDAIYASPMTRASETAKLIAADLPGVKLETLPQLAECTPRTRRKEAIAGETDESMSACAAKLDALFKEHFIPAAGAPRREIFVCHGNVTRYLVTRALGVDPAAWLEMSVGHASMTVILIEPDGRPKVIAVGDLGHIPPNMQTGATGMPERNLAVPK